MNYIIGGGMTGLSSGMASNFPVFERNSLPGGICDSYQLSGYRFETGGGHWIYGSDPIINRMLEKIGELRSYRRKSAVLFLGGEEATKDLKGTIVPYPIQDNLFALPRDLRFDALNDIMRSEPKIEHLPTMAAWLEAVFGSTLYRIFFDPFHERYTQGLHKEIGVQDAYKSPIDKLNVNRGAEREQADTGYNATFVYPAKGLDSVSRWLAGRCDVRYESPVKAIYTVNQLLEMNNGETIPYDTVVSTSPLNQIVEMAGLREEVGPPDPHTSVFVINLGVKLPDTKEARHGYHWLYTPDSKSGFHRVGYYSNVDPLFVPEGYRKDGSRGSLYIESAFREGVRPSDDYVDNVIAELKSNGLIDEVEVCDPTWVEVAYTWRMPGSDWVSRATRACNERGIIPAGRYGKWCFQGVAGSLKEGLMLGSILREGGVDECFVRGTRPREESSTRIKTA